MKKYKSYKYLIKPSEAQKKIINKIFGYVRFVHNLYVEDIRKGNRIHRLAKEVFKISVEHPDDVLKKEMMLRVKPFSVKSRTFYQSG